MPKSLVQRLVRIFVVFLKMLQVFFGKFTKNFV